MTKLEDNPKFLLLLCNNINSLIGRPITNKEFAMIRNVIRNDKIGDYVKIKPHNLISYYTDNIIQKQFDIHEMLRPVLKIDENTKNNHINIKIANLLGITSKEELKLLFKPKYKKKQIILDTINQDRSVDCFSGKVSWYINTTKYFAEESANFNFDFRNIIGIKLSPCRWEYSPEYLYMTNITRWTVCIEEFNAQSFIYPISQTFSSAPPNYGVVTNTRKFHFIFALGSIAALDSSGTYNYYDMDIKGFNEGYYWFDPPVTILSNKITLSFGMPFNSFCIKSQKFTGLIGKSIDNHLTITSLHNPLVINDNRALPLMYGSLTLDGFTTANPVTDAALISSINGHTFTPTYPVNQYTIQFNAIDLTGITLTGGSMNCYTNNYRMIFQLEFIYLDQ